MDTSKMAGSAVAILQDESVKKVFEEFAEGCSRCYNMNIWEKKTFVSVRVLRQVRSFVKQYGEDDAIKIIRTAFDVFHQGKWNGNPIGTSIFASGNNWMANKFLIESEQASGFINAQEPKPEPTASKQPATKVKWKSVIT